MIFTCDPLKDTVFQPDSITVVLLVRLVVWSQIFIYER